MDMDNAIKIRLAPFSLVMFVVACGSSKAPVMAPPATRAVQREHNEAQVSVSSEVGALDEDAVNSVFERTQGGLMGCAKKGARRVQFLGGEIGFFVSINQAGQAEDARVEHSTIGDRDTESCMLAVLRGKAWPKPVGGRKGQVHKSFAFDMSNDARPPVEWSADDVESTLKKLHKRIEECTGGGSGTYQVTAYIDTHGSPISVGVAPPDAVADSQVDCLVAVIKGTKFKSPGSYPAKVSFEL